MKKKKVSLSNVLCALTVLFIETVTSRWVVDDCGCITPNNGVGACIPIIECESILRYSQIASPQTAIVKETIESYYCGAFEASPKVCCPYDNEIAEVVLKQSMTMFDDSDNVQTDFKSSLPEAGQCGTPCVPIKECQTIIDFIKKSSPLTANDIDMLRNYQCSDSGKVCCPDGALVQELPPDVTNHRNLKFLPQQCGALSSNRVINGNKTELLEYPWMALLSYRFLSSGATDFACGGTIINDWYILTAAHCIIDRSSRQLISVRVGEYDISTELDCMERFGSRYCAPPVQDIPIAEVIPHPDFNYKNSNNDIGLIRLARRINSNVETVKPICLPTTQELRNQDFEQTRLTVTGWGVTETGRRSFDLLQAVVPVVSTEECQQVYKGTSSISVSYKSICAGGKSEDACGGDSGGPLQLLAFHNDDVRFIQVGIVSFGPKLCGEQNRPGIYTRVDYYMDWILDNIKLY